MRQKDEETYTFICECGDVADQIIMRFWSDDVEEKDYPSVYISYHLNKFSFWKRLLAGIRYIFGYTTKFGDFGEVVIVPEDYPKMQKVCDYLKKVLDIREETTRKRKEKVGS